MTSLFCTHVQSDGGDGAPFKKFKSSKSKEPETPKVFTKEERRALKKERRARKPHGEVRRRVDA